MTTHPQTQPHQRQKKTTARPTSHRQPTATSLPPVRAVDDHRKKPASTQNRPPSPKNRCKIATKSGQKKNYRPLLPDFSAISAISAIFPPKHVPPFRRPHNSCSSLVRPRMRSKPNHPNAKKEKTPRSNPTLTRHTATQPDITRPPPPNRHDSPTRHSSGRPPHSTCQHHQQPPDTEKTGAKA